MPKILFAVDGSEASLRAARGLAGILSWWKATDVEVLNVQPESFIFSELVPNSLRERAESQVREEGERALAMARGLLRAAAAGCASTVRFGDAATAIARAAEMLDCAMIAMGSHGAGAVGSLVTGSVTTKVIHVGSRPVLVIPSARPQAGSVHKPPHRAARVLVPVDGSVGATAALRETLRIASWFRNAPEIHLFAVYEATRLDAEIAALVTEEALLEHQHERFEAALLPAREVLFDTAFEAIEHTAIGPPAEKIRAIIETHLFDLVASERAAWVRSAT